MNIIEKQIENNILMGETRNNTEESETRSKEEETRIKEEDPALSLLKNIKRAPECNLIVIDHFYNNPMETRNYVLTQEFSVKGNFPGQRTISYANSHLKETIQKYLSHTKITDFPCPKPDNSDASQIYNGSFQYTTSRDRSWVHTDKWNNWAGVLYLTPDAPLSSGTGFYRFKDGAMSEEDTVALNNEKEVNRFTQDMTQWELVDRVGNVFNRLILFNAHKYHMSMDYFGDSKENGRLFQTFFFSTQT